MRHRPLVNLLAAAVAVAPLLAGCGLARLGEVVDGGPPPGIDAVVDVSVSDGGCEVSPLTVEPGQVALVVTNDAGEDARFRFYSGGVDPIGEIPELAAGATRTLLVDSVIEGDYVAACSVGGGAEDRHSMRAGKEPLRDEG